MMEKEELPVLKKLDELNIPYRHFTHKPALTMEDCKGFDLSQNAAHCKNIFLTNRQGTNFYLLLVAGDKPFNTKDISRQLEVSRLSFASAAVLKEKLNLSPGAVTPMGLIHENARDVNVLIDKQLLDWENVLVHPNVNTASLLIKQGDLLNFICQMGNKVTMVDVAG